MFSVITKYHKGRHSLFLYNSEIFYAFTQDILRSLNLLNHSSEAMTLAYLGLDQASTETMLDQIDFG
ncbi:2,5 diketo-D-gluconic acid-like reductase [Lactiplantibacillus plantarum]|nr:2,5 diketo-D-gluconic acid-like reductase [Lactiplantibacillus plantarum]